MKELLWNLNPYFCLNWFSAAMNGVFLALNPAQWVFYSVLILLNVPFCVRSAFLLSERRGGPR